MTIPLPSALLLDMDGTLTEPLLDFPRIKAEMNIGNRPILEAMAEMSPEARRIAEAVLFGHEEEAAARSTLNPGCRELLDWVNDNNLPSALITRNSLTSVTTVLARHDLHFEVLVTREDGKYKPDPAPLRLACDKLRADVARAWMVGDGQYDVEAGLAAGCATVWVSHGRRKPFAAEPLRTVGDLRELTALLGTCRAS
jgi:HAD superfamily hydrolase (TIGR01509 family)